GYAWQKGWAPVSRAALLRAIELNDVAVDKNRRAFEYGRRIAVHGAPAAEQSNPHRQDPPTLDEIIRDRVDLLTKYQDAAYAARYERAVERVRRVEAALGAGAATPLSSAVAHNLAKLMAYKDEYEVARLHSDPAFLQKLRATFVGEPGKDYRLRFHLAPPLFSRRDAQGRLVKSSYGRWMQPALRLLAGLKKLRGGRLDPFGRTAERRMERRLIEEYFEMLEEFCETLSADNRDAAVTLARIPEQIRGYGHVKERSIAAASLRREMLLNRYRTRVRLSA
ncbi:MAG: hypothetical protein RBS02_07410, partial [Steroidobacteraceae bacterium]|nr:hypothetical protein [Steroidobacteraceae bacterium]